MSVTERVRQGLTAFAVLWPLILFAALLFIGIWASGGVEVLVLVGLVVVQLVWLALWFGTPVAAKAVGRALGRRAD